MPDFLSGPTVGGVPVSLDGHIHPVATTTMAGFESAADKSKLDAVGRGAEATRSTNMTVASGSATTIPMEAETHDDGDFFDLANPTYFTIAATGFYIASLAFGYVNLSASAARLFFDLVHQNSAGANIRVFRSESYGAPGGNPRTTMAALLRANAGERIAFQTYQNSGASQTLGAGSVAIARLT